MSDTDNKIYIYTVKLTNLKVSLHLGCFSSMEKALEYIEDYKSMASKKELLSREFKYGFSVIISLLDHAYFVRKEKECL